MLLIFKLCSVSVEPDQPARIRRLIWSHTHRPQRVSLLPQQTDPAYYVEQVCRNNVSVHVRIYIHTSCGTAPDDIYIAIIEYNTQESYKR